MGGFGSISVLVLGVVPITEDWYSPFESEFGHVAFIMI
jgi:hypothetical protein